MVVLSEEIYVETIFFLDWALVDYRFRSQGAVFRVGNQTDPDRLTENPRCLESVGIEADRSASGYPD